MKIYCICSLLISSIVFCSCHQGIICTTEFRMVMLKVKNSVGNPVVLDSFYTVRQSNNQKIHSLANPPDGFYVVLDDSHHSQLQMSEDNFRFLGWKNNQLIVDELYRIGADNCHISRNSGVDSVVVQ